MEQVVWSSGGLLVLSAVGLAVRGISAAEEMSRAVTDSGQDDAPGWMYAAHLGCLPGLRRGPSAAAQLVRQLSLVRCFGRCDAPTGAQILFGCIVVLAACMALVYCVWFGPHLRALLFSAPDVSNGERRWAWGLLAACIVVSFLPPALRFPLFFVALLWLMHCVARVRLSAATRGKLQRWLLCPMGLLAIATMGALAFEFLPTSSAPLWCAPQDEILCVRPEHASHSTGLSPLLAARVASHASFYSFEAKQDNFSSSLLAPLGPSDQQYWSVVPARFVTTLSEAEKEQLNAGCDGLGLTEDGKWSVRLQSSAALRVSVLLHQHELLTFLGAAVYAGLIFNVFSTPTQRDLESRDLLSARVARVTTDCVFIFLSVHLFVAAFAPHHF